MSSDTGHGAGTGTDTGGCPAADPQETTGPYPADGSVASGASRLTC
ncbi:hypothetical protein [Deinococcus sp. Leaf326]|nr:hypothetical protein [Deinococcus sp. Leaf326]